MASGSRQYRRVDELDEVRNGIVDRKLIYDRIRDGIIPHVKIGERAVLVPNDWADICAGIQQPTPMSTIAREPIPVASILLVVDGLRGVLDWIARIAAAHADETARDR